MTPSRTSSRPPSTTASTSLVRRAFFCRPSSLPPSTFPSFASASPFLSPAELRILRRQRRGLLERSVRDRDGTRLQGARGRPLPGSSFPPRKFPIEPLFARFAVPSYLVLTSLLSVQLVISTKVRRDFSDEIAKDSSFFLISSPSLHFQIFFGTGKSDINSRGNSRKVRRRCSYRPFLSQRRFSFERSVCCASY